MCVCVCVCVCVLLGGGVHNVLLQRHTSLPSPLHVRMGGFLVQASVTRNDTSLALSNAVLAGLNAVCNWDEHSAATVPTHHMQYIALETHTCYFTHWTVACQLYFILVDRTAKTPDVLPSCRLTGTTRSRALMGLQGSTRDSAASNTILSW